MGREGGHDGWSMNVHYNRIAAPWNQPRQETPVLRRESEAASSDAESSPANDDE